MKSISIKAMWFRFKSLKAAALFIPALVFLTANPCQAGGAFNLPQLDPSQTTGLFNNLAADMAFRPVAPASSIGRLFGFSFGLTAIGANASSSAIGSNNSTIYAGDISAALQAPMGLAIEAGLLPGTSFSGTTFNRFGLDAKWTFTDLFPILPLDAAVRVMYTNASLGYSEPVNGGTINVSYTTNMTGATLSISKSFLVLEPYLAYGLAQHTSSISGSGTSSLFNGNFPGGTSSTSGTGSSGWFQGGVQVKLLTLTLAAEYDNLFATDSYALRLAFQF